MTRRDYWTERLLAGDEASRTFAEEGEGTKLVRKKGHDVCDDAAT